MQQTTVTSLPCDREKRQSLRKLKAVVSWVTPIAVTEPRYGRRSSSPRDTRPDRKDNERHQRLARAARFVAQRQRDASSDQDEHALRLARAFDLRRRGTSFSRTRASRSHEGTPPKGHKKRHAKVLVDPLDRFFCPARGVLMN